MKNISILLLITALLTLASCSNEIEVEPIEADSISVENTESKIIEVEPIETEELEVKEISVDESETVVVQEEVIDRFLVASELDGALAIYDRQEQLFWESETSKFPQQWSISENWTEPIFTDEGYVFTVEQTLLESEAFEYCLEKGEGWRLPQKDELSTLISKNFLNSSGKQSELMSLSQDLYWTGNQVNDINSAWVINFSNGEIQESTGEDEVYTICVHDELDLTGGISDEEFEALN